MVGKLQTSRLKGQSKLVTANRPGAGARGLFILSNALDAAASPAAVQYMTPLMRQCGPSLFAGCWVRNLKPDAKMALGERARVGCIEREFSSVWHGADAIVGMAGVAYTGQAGVPTQRFRVWIGLDLLTG